MDPAERPRHRDQESSPYVQCSFECIRVVPFYEDEPPPRLEAEAAAFVSLDYFWIRTIQEEKWHEEDDDSYPQWELNEWELNEEDVYACPVCGLRGRGPMGEFPVDWDIRMEYGPLLLMSDYIDDLPSIPFWLPSDVVMVVRDPVMLEGMILALSNPWTMVTEILISHPNPEMDS